MFNNSTGFTMPVVPAGYGTSGMGFGGFGSDWIGLIVILALLGGWGNGFGGFGGGGGRQGYATPADLTTQSIIQKLDGQTYGLADSTYALNSGITTGFAGVQQTLCQGFNGVNTGMLTGFNSLQAQLADCCCENRAAISQVRYDMATQACDTRNLIQNVARDITDNANANTRSILDFLVNDKLSALQAENNSLKQNAFFNAALDARTAEIIRRTGNDCPVPAYVVQPPTQVTFPYGFNNCGCGC